LVWQISRSVFASSLAILGSTRGADHLEQARLAPDAARVADAQHEVTGRVGGVAEPAAELDDLESDKLRRTRSNSPRRKLARCAWHDARLRAPGSEGRGRRRFNVSARG
jgi:hypothetical protein